ncbi:hypothetical protein P7G87_02700 [Enterococcus asini]|uniref:hypothetical protein n=1 Tax=Enterococcus asini TaxID=57732 RepID=UPI00288DC9CA|nr:hypothetical protein [Enterococcus asini]EMF0045807.1 hypothetical protein [Enterococcus hirae]EMF0159258.1 hypothetical protein [Enterococcus hirae]MDT2783602.1 hypothetical protein [Enterococcus asini]
MTIKQDINQIIKNVPDGYYLEKIETQIIHGEVVTKGIYQPKYEIHCEEFQWIAPGGNSYQRPTTSQFNGDLMDLQNKGKRVEVVEFIKEKTKAYSNEQNSNINEDGVENGEINIENSYNELLTVVYKIYS